MVRLGNVSCGCLGASREAGDEEADDGEGSPGAGEAVGSNLRINGRVGELGGGLMGEGVILYVPEIDWTAGLWDDAEGGRLERTDEGFEGSLGEWTEVSAFGQFFGNDVVELLSVFDDGVSVGWHLGSVDWGNLEIEARPCAHALREVGHMPEEWSRASC